MIKYSVPGELIQELLDLGLCETEESAREKVASGEAPELIKEAKLKILKALEQVTPEETLHGKD